MKTMMKATAALIALGLSGTAMAATDGSLGATSTGNFSASVNILLDTSNYVQIIGLEDVDFGNITIPQFTTHQDARYQYVCFKKNTPGNVSLAVSQTPSSTGSVAISFIVADPNGDPINLSAFPASPSACTASSGAGEAHRIGTFLSAPSTAPVGAVSVAYTLTLSVQ